MTPPKVFRSLIGCLLDNGITYAKKTFKTPNSLRNLKHPSSKERLFPSYVWAKVTEIKYNKF